MRLFTTLATVALIAVAAIAGPVSADDPGDRNCFPKGCYDR